MLLALIGTIVSFQGASVSHPLAFNPSDYLPLDQDTLKKDTTKNEINLKYPIKQDEFSPYKKLKSHSLDLKNPNAIEESSEIDTSGTRYKTRYKVAGDDIGEEKESSFEEHLEEENKEFVREYFKRRTLSANNVLKGGTGEPNVLKTEGLFGSFMGGLIDIRPTGSAELIFAIERNRILNPNWSIREQRNTQFKFDQKLQLNVIGSIGDRFKIGINYNTETSFDFQNQRKINYNGKEDEIIKSFELGDVSMPVSNSLIRGSQSLFGVKSRMQFGKLYVDGIFAQSRGERKEITVENGAQKSQFNITADNYEVNRHFLLGQYFHDNYNQFNKNYPALSNVVITRIQVWVTNSQNTIQNSRTVVAFMDLGENNPYNKTVIAGGGGAYPDNNSNSLYALLTANPNYRDNTKAADELDKLRNQGYFAGQDYVKIDNARLLQATEYTLNQRLGYISLNFQPRPNDVIGVAFEYTLNGQTYRVGELAQDLPPDPSKPNVMFLKMLKSNITYTQLPIWNLMMKNIYSLNTFQLSPTDFKLQVIYEDNQSGAFLNYLPVPSEPLLNAIPLVRVLSMDRFNSQGELKPDGNFDFLEGVTVTSNGRIIFPILEPFGNDLRAKFNDKTIANFYTYDSLYRSTRAVAIQQADKNKFYLRGTYQGSSGSDISLNAINVPQGSVKVFAGSQELRENVDYTVDYTLGRVKIINPAIISSGSVIRVSLESNSLFNIQQKTLMGGRAEYKFNKDFFLGATYLYLRERPLTPKVTAGDEAIRNGIWGLDGSYTTESQFLTRLVDKLPFYSTKEKSNIFIKGEFAQIIPGHPKLLNDPLDAGKGGLSYIDDFEASEVPFDLRLGNYWVLSSTPEGVSKFPEASLSNDLRYGFNRSKLSWYTIDPIFFRNTNNNPIRSDKELQSNHYTREVLETELFPNKQLPSGVPGTLTTFDLSFFPNQRGPYNYNVDELNPDGTLNNPSKRWGGIMRRIETSDFEAANIQYIEFWMMDPFIYKPNHQGGDMFIQIGNLSEDILKDRAKSYENGLPKSTAVENISNTAWGRVSTLQQINSAFETDPEARKYQDVGFDGLGPVGSDEDERSFFDSSYLSKLKAKFGENSLAYKNATNDPSSDNFRFYTGEDYDNVNADLIQRYKRYNNPQGNTPVASNDQTNGYGTPNPDDEDINRDFTLNTVPEQYFEYKLRITPGDLPKNFANTNNYCTNVMTVPVSLKNGTLAPAVTWYQFKIPVTEFTRRFGNIPDFRSIQFMRIFMTGWEDSVTLRFGQLQLVRGEWRPYLFNLQKPGEYVPVDDKNTEFIISSVNLERNGNRRPPYVMPPGIQRTIDYSTPDQIQQNEQSLSLRVCNLPDGDARSVFKNTTFDIRLYKKLRMFIHAEGENLKDGDLTAFIRVGTDLNSNFYEYEMPLSITPLNAKDKEAIWPELNNLTINLEDFYNTKQERNVSRVSLLVPYYKFVDGGKGKITILGNPDLSNIKTIMVGVRNPKNELNPDGSPVCGEVWFNELRLTDFDEQGGWAANTTIRTKLADLATITLSAERRTIGFGALEQTVQQRSQRDSRSYDLSVGLDADKLLPKFLRLSIPTYFTYGETTHRPRFNPLLPDLPFQNVVNSYEGNPDAIDSVYRSNLDYTKRTTLNFSNVRKNPNPKKKINLPWDIENFTASYSYGEIFRRNIEREYDINRSYKGQIGYTYSFNSKPIEPFKFLKKNKSASKYLALLADANIYYLPQSWSFTFEGIRNYSEIMYRNTDNFKAILEPMFDKSFRMSRNYGLRHNVTKAIRINYSAQANSFIPEPEGRLDTREKKQYVWDTLKTFGRLNNFAQKTDLNWDVPINKLPFMEWVTLGALYSGTYSWQMAFPATPQFGNTISNSATVGGNANLNFVALYSKSKYLKNIVSGNGNAAKYEKPKPPTQQTATKGKKPKKKTKAKKKKEKEKQKELADKDTTIKPDVNIGLIKATDAILRLATSLRQVSINYSQSEGTALPGYMPKPTYLGLTQDTNRNFKNAPGLPFVFGFQEDIRLKAKQNGWITRDTNLSSFYMKSYSENLGGQATLEPIKGFRISVSFNRRYTLNTQENFRFRSQSPEPESFGTFQTGNFSISALPIKTAFKGDKAFQVFEKDYRQNISRRLGEGNPDTAISNIDSGGFTRGYKKNHQEVLMYSFLAAYMGKNVNTFTLEMFSKIPKPNWTVNYNGLSNIDFVKEYAKNVTLSHGYNSTYTIGSFISSLSDTFTRPGLLSTGVKPEYIIDNISLTENFSPLLGLDVQWNSGWTTKVEYKKSRNVSLAFTNYQVNEQRSYEIVFGAGYRTNKLLLPFKINRKQVYLKNDLTVKADFSIRDNINEVRVIDQGTSQSSAGQRVITITPNVDYMLNKSLNIRFFWTALISKPYVSTQYPTTNTKAGFSLRYTLSP